MRTLLKFCLFGMLGFSAEIIFTASVDMYHMLQGHIPLNWKLEGRSYIWMFFIYGLTAFLFPPVYKFVGKYFILVRLVVYAVIIFLVEFITGWMLDMITGKCPWEYTSRWNVCGYIRLDYLPVWMLFGFIGERAYRMFDRFTASYSD